MLAVVLIVLAAAAGLAIANRDVQSSPPQSGQPAGPVRASGAPFAGPIDAATFRRIAEAQRPMVVNIRTESRRQTRDMTEFFSQDDMLRRFFGPDFAPPQPREEVLEGAGSGFIVDKSGLILTNNHVVTGATRIEVAFFAAAGTSDDETYAAKVVGRDPLTDSALLKLTEMPDAGLPVAQFGDSDQMAPGDWVVAIGNPFNFAHTVTVGVISASHRPFRPVAGRVQQFLQTDAAINPGNSGGPLLNLRGEVIGINTAIFSTAAGGGNMGIGFAIPMNTVRELLPELAEGKVTRGQIGVQVGPVPRDAFRELGLTEPSGALVAAVEPRSPAAQAGVQPGDVIVGYNQERIDSTDELVDLVVKTAPGTRVPVEIVRGQQRLTVDVTAQELQLGDTPAAAALGSEAAESFGLTIAPLTADVARQMRIPAGTTGVVVTNVASRSAAERGGVQPGDVVVEVNRTPVRSVNDVSSALQRASGGTVFLLVQRGDQRLFLTLTR
jgi:serine protease Do